MSWPNGAYIAARRELAEDYDRPAPLPRAVLNLSCPHCRVSPGSQCVVRKTSRPLRHVQAHPSRFVAAGVPVPLPTMPDGAQGADRGQSGVPGADAGSVAAEGRQVAS